MFNSRQGLRIFLFSTAASRPALRPTQPPIQWVHGIISLGIKRPWLEVDHSPTSIAEIKNMWSYNSTTQYVFMVWGLVKHSDNFAFCKLVTLILSRHQNAGQNRSIKADTKSENMVGLRYSGTA
jgi:hypothetical protein